MILTKEQVEKRLASDLNITNPLSPLNKDIEVLPEVIRKDGVNNHNGKQRGNLTEEERISIGVVASVTDSKTAAEIFGVHPSHANDLKNGNRNIGNVVSGSSLRTTDNELKLAIKSRLESTKLTIQERAAEKLLATLGLFDDVEVQDKLKNANPREIAQVANLHSQIFRNMTSQNKSDESESKQKVKIIIQQPRTSREEAFDTVEIGF